MYTWVCGFAINFAEKKPCVVRVWFWSTKPRPVSVNNGISLDTLSRLKGIETIQLAYFSMEL